MPDTKSEDTDYWIIDNPFIEAVRERRVNTEWVGLVSERSGGIVAYGRRDIMEACAEALNAKPDDWEGV